MTLSRKKKPSSSFARSGRGTRIAPKPQIKPSPIKPLNIPRGETLELLAWPNFDFGHLWQSFFETDVPNYTKSKYYPGDRLRDTPFNQKDVRFFSKSIVELSSFFTDDRSDLKKTKDYFSQPKYRSAYLLYLMQLQAAKFYHSLTLHPTMLDQMIEEANKKGRLSFWDIGSGPASATLGVLVRLLEHPELPESLELDVHLNDQNAASIADGTALLERLIEASKKVVKLNIFSHTQNLLSPGARRNGLPIKECTLVLLGNFLNELKENKHRDMVSELVSKLLENSKLGVLFIEPAAKPNSQWLSHLRDENLLIAFKGQIKIKPLGKETQKAQKKSEDLDFFEDDGLLSLDDIVLPDESPKKQKNKPKTKAEIVGPCLHSGACPLSYSRDWCHFSLPVKIPSEFFQQFAVSLGSKREWIKFSYLWIKKSASKPATPKTAGPELILSDPLDNAGRQVLVCQPERVRVSYLDQPILRHIQGRGSSRGRKAVKIKSRGDRG